MPPMKDAELKELYDTMYSLLIKERRRLDFLDIVLKEGIPIGFKPGYIALVGSVYTEGASSIRDLIDKLIMINNGEIEPDANQSGVSEEQGRPVPKD